MFYLKLFYKFLIILQIISVISADVCDSVSPICDCFIDDHGEFGTDYQLNCSDIQNGENEFNINTKLSYPPTLEIDCIQFNSLTALPALNINDKFATIKFKNCFNNDTNHANYKFKFFDFVRKKLSVGFWSKIDIRFDVMAKVDEDMFFGNWNYPRLTHIYIENIYFETSIIFKKRNDIKMFSLSNTHLIDMDNFNENCPTLRDLDFRQTRSLKNFNKINLRKIKNLEGLRIIDCQIENYYEQVYLEGSIFESNAKLNSITLEAVYDDSGEIIKLNESIFNNVQLTTVQLVDLKLERLSPKIFWTLNKLSYLVLQNNRLGHLDPNIFIKCPVLKYIDLSKNNFVKFANTNIFSKIIPLQELHLSHNRLTAFAYDASNQSQLEKIQLDHNKMKLNTNVCPIINMRYHGATIDMSYNKIKTSLAALDCLLKNDLKILNISNNQIVELNFNNFSAKINSTPLDTEVDFRNNKISAIDVLHSDSDWNGNAYPHHHINLHIDQNPMFCENCSNIKRIYARDFFFVRLSNGSIIKINHPHECRATVFCGVHEYINPNYKCPLPCDCLYNEFSQELMIDCENRNLTEIPYLNASDLFELNITRLNLNLKNNFIENIVFARTIPDGDELLFPVIDAIGKIDLGSNWIEQLHFKPFEFPAHLVFLRLDSNRITHIDNETFELLNSRHDLLTVSLDNNTITRDLVLYDDLKQRIEFKLIEVQEEIENDSNQIEHDNEIKEKKQVRSKSVYMAWLVLPIAVIFLILATYVYRQHSVGRLFKGKETRNRE